MREVDITLIDFEYVGKINKERLRYIRMRNALCKAAPMGSTIVPGGHYISGDIHIGDRVIIQPGAVIGAWGMTFERDEDNKIVRMEQSGGVILEDDVEIGANTIIDRGSISGRYTIVRTGARIDNLCNIGHNCIVGKHTYIAASSSLAGSVVIGDYCWLGIHVAVRQHIKIGDHTVIGMGSVITKDIPPMSIAYGNPCKIVRERKLYKDEYQ